MASSLEKELIRILQNHCGERGDNEGACETLNRIIRERDSAKKEADEHIQKERNDLYDIFAPTPEGMIITSFALDRAPEPRRITKAQIARRAGELVTIESEYYDLKDRTLPVPKMQVLEDEREKGKGGVDVRRLI